MPVYTFTTLDDPSASKGTTEASGINDAGQIVGTFSDSKGTHGFIVSNGIFTTLDDPAATFGTFAAGINNSGTVVGSFSDAGFTFEGFIKSSGGYTTLDDPLATGDTVLQGINASGVIVGSYGNRSGEHGFIYNPNGATFTTLDDPAATFGTFAQGINDSGMVVGSYDAGDCFHGFIYNPSAGTYTTLDNPLAATTHGTMPMGINNAGQIVGVYEDSSGIQHGFLYSGGFFTTIDDPSATGGTIPRGINDAGQIAGIFIDASGTHGFLETTLPNPAAPPGTTADMVLRGANTSAIAGQYEIYNIGSNTILAGYSLGQVGTDWGFVTLGGFNGSDTSDMVLRNVNTGAFEVYDIANNQITGASALGSVGLDWQVGGIAPNASTTSNAAMGDSSQVAQLAQAMASFGGGAADTSNPVALGADTSQQTLLTTPQHASG
jgi:probable HAF family extracellular repeat protein